MGTTRTIALTAAAIGVPTLVGWFTWSLCRAAAIADRTAPTPPESGEQ